MNKFFNLQFVVLSFFLISFLFVEPAQLAAQASKVSSSNNNSLDNSVPRLEMGECALPIPPNEKPECGYLIVYENRETNKGRTIRLPFIIMKSDSPNPLSDPIIYTSGGPGSSSLGQVRNRQYNPYLKTRNYILFEQRGTKYSQPSLQCPEVNLAQREAAKRNLAKHQATDLQLKAVRACREDLIKSGINLSAYNSRSSAADIDDLRRLLKIEKWNLYGVSYSTRLMLTVMRYYPQGVRSAVLDSVLPPSVNYDETSVDGVVNSLSLVFADCRKDSECATKYPNLENRFFSVIQRLSEKPATISVKDSDTATEITLQINNNDFANGIYDALETGYKLPLIPALIDGVERNNIKALKNLAEIKLDNSGFAWGMRYSVWCSEEMPFQNQNLIKKQISTAYPKLKGFGIQTDFPAICAIWNVKPAPEIENKPVKSNIPALILAGQYDPDTPPIWGKLAAKMLINSRFFEIPAMSHVPTFGSNCAQQLAENFFNNPSGSIDSQCVEKVLPIKFEFESK